MKILCINDSVLINLTTFLEIDDIKELMLVSQEAFGKINNQQMIKHRMLTEELSKTRLKIKV